MKKKPLKFRLYDQGGNRVMTGTRAQVKRRYDSVDGTVTDVRTGKAVSPAKLFARERAKARKNIRK